MSGSDDLDVVQADRGIDGEVARLGALAHDLLVNLALGRHINDEIALDERRAAQPAALGEGAAGGIARLPLARWAQMVGRTLDPELGEVARARLDLTAAAEAPAPAYRIEIDADGAGGIEDRRADGEPPALAGRGEDDERGFGHAVTR